MNTVATEVLCTNQDMEKSNSAEKIRLELNPKRI